jgi:hypothetical protein
MSCEDCGRETEINKRRIRQQKEALPEVIFASMKTSSPSRNGAPLNIDHHKIHKYKRISPLLKLLRHHEVFWCQGFLGAETFFCSNILRKISVTTRQKV